ncbi:TetR/AcrR family transcriptional regulator [Mycobacterium intermedium]|uniref:TetR/AcrR family transcriptional regulator n=1 Tax=Mycobacterium intermedium TaxID=28445 RepID=UPI001E478501|nr:TetR/AcrR family transcriptional regulator [Mycobacterium intermedium]
MIHAAEEVFAETEPGAVQMEAIAKRAGVSRATAFRRMGSISEVVVQVAIRRAQRHIAAVQELMAAQTGVFAKVEAALIYTARELPTDASIAALIAQHSTGSNDPRVHEAAVGAMGPVVREGQRNGEIRTDVPFDDLIDFLVEQTYLAAEGVDRSEAAVRKRFRQFVVPAIEARDGHGGDILSRARELRDTAAATAAAAQSLVEQLEGRTRT